MIDQRFTQSEKLNSVRRDARLLYASMLPFLDREGRMCAEPLVVKVTVFRRSDFTVEEITCYLTELAEVGLIRLYADADNEAVLEYAGFLDFNSPNQRERQSEHPAPGSAEAMPLRDAALLAHSQGTCEACAMHVQGQCNGHVNGTERLTERSTFNGTTNTSDPNSQAAPAELVPQAAPHAPVKRENRKELHEALLTAWNEHRGPLPAVQALTEKRRNGLRAFLKEVPAGTDPVAIFTAAVTEVARDPFWIERKYNLDNLLRAGRVIEKAEKHAAGPAANPNTQQAVERATSLAERIKARREHQP